MNVKFAFRSLLLLEVALSVVMLPLTVAVSSPLPSDLARYLEALSPPGIEGPLAWLFALLEAVAVVGLFLLIRGARELYVTMIAVSLATTLYDGVAAVLPGPTYVAVQVERIVTGMIIGLAYFSPVASRLRIGGVDRRGGGSAVNPTPSNAVEQ